MRSFVTQYSIKNNICFIKDSIKGIYVIRKVALKIKFLFFVKDHILFLIAMVYAGV